MYYNTMQQPMNTTQMPYQQNMNQMYTQNQNPTQTQQIQPPFNSLHSNDPYNVMYHQHGLQQYGSMGTNSPAPSSPAPTPESDPEIEKLRKEIEDIKKTRQQRKLEEHLNYLSVQETNAPQQTMKIEPVRDTRSQSVSVAGLRRTVTSAPQVRIITYPFVMNPFKTRSGLAARIPSQISNYLIIINLNVNNRHSTKRYL
jgi:hypothetical protein